MAEFCVRPRSTHLLHSSADCLSLSRTANALTSCTVSGGGDGGELLDDDDDGVMAFLCRAN